MPSKSESEQNDRIAKEIGSAKKTIQKARSWWEANECQDLRLVIIKWIDSGLCDPTWIEASSYEDKPMPICMTVGWLYKRTKDKTILFSSYSLENDEYKKGNEGTIQLILNKCIIDVQEVC
jgi:hypothetical protein